MINNKKISIIVAVAMILALIASMAMFFGAGTYTGKVTDYEKKLFNGEVVEIEIQVDETDWNDLLENATTKEYVSADVTLNGDLFSSVGIRTKGNSSLTQVASSDSDRYSLQLNPNKYVKGQSFYGLDTLAINNIVSDATYMKDSISYDIMEYLGVPTPLRNYARVTVNGEYYGLCLLLERYDDSFLDRTYNSTTGELYNVKSMVMAGGDQKNDVGGMDFPAGGERPEMPTQEQQNTAKSVSDSTDAVSESTTSIANTDQASQPQQKPEGMTPPDGATGMQQPPDMPTGNTERQGAGGPPALPEGVTAQATKTTPAEDVQTDSEQNTDTAQETTQSSSSEETKAATDQPANNRGDRNQQGGGGGIMGGMGSSSGGGSLLYTDDDPTSYSSIFNNAVSSKVSDKDKQQVITAIQKLNEGKDLETYWDVDEILRYFAAHTFVVNLDSYVSNMQQNYYILEKNGQLSILPWDYNLAFGGFNSGSASEVVNFPIDTPVSGVSMEDRPLLNQLLSVEEYKEKYHEYLNEIVEGYVNSGLFQEEVERINDEIGSYVKEDTTGFYTYNEYQTAVAELVNLVDLRAESVEGQLNGTIPSTSEGQQQDSSSLIDASSITLSALGGQGGGDGKGFGGGMAKPGEQTTQTESAETQQFTTQPQMPTKNDSEQSGQTDAAQQQTATQSDSATPKNGQINVAANQLEELREIQQAALNGTLSDEQKAQLDEWGITEEQLVEFSQIMEQGGMPGMGGNAPGQSNQTVVTTTLSWQDWVFYGVLAALLVAAIIFVAKKPRYKQKNK